MSANTRWKRFSNLDDAIVSQPSQQKKCACGNRVEAVMTGDLCYSCNRDLIALRNMLADNDLRGLVYVALTDPAHIRTGSDDPRTPEQIDVDAWQAETQATRRGDDPR